MAAEEELQAEVELESSRVRFRARSATVVSVPIGVDYDRIQQLAADAALLQEQQRLRDLLGLRADIIGLGVDRLDYTKGIPERLDALDALMVQRPDLRGKLTFVQIGVPSRSDLQSYASIEAEIGRRIAAVNERYAVPGGSPVVSYYTTPLGVFSLVALYRLAHFCIVSSLHARGLQPTRRQDDCEILDAGCGPYLPNGWRSACDENHTEAGIPGRGGHRHAARCARRCGSWNRSPSGRRSRKLRSGLDWCGGTFLRPDPARCEKRTWWHRGTRYRAPWRAFVLCGAARAHALRHGREL